jgi:hypothetical protein
MRDYSCDVCIFSKLYKRRTCFLYASFPDGEKGHRQGDFFNIPRFTEDRVPLSDELGHLQGEVRYLDREGFLEVLWDLSEALPHYSAYQILSSYFGEVCPTAFSDPICASLIGAQASCAEYTVNISDDSVRNEVLGFYMTLQDTLEAFDIVTAAKNAYERYETERLQKKSNTVSS